MRVAELGLSPATLACLHTAGIVNVGPLLARPCNELIEHPAIGPAELYEIIRQLNKRGLMLPYNQYGDVRIPSQRTLEMFRLRFVEGLTLAEVGRRNGVTNSRVHQLLRSHFGASNVPPAVKARWLQHRGREAK